MYTLLYFGELLPKTVDNGQLSGLRYDFCLKKCGEKRKTNIL